MTARGNDPAGPASLTLQLRLSCGLPRPRGAVVLVNVGRTAAGVWQTGNQWGDAAVSFEVRHEGRVERIVRCQQVYTRNVPSSFMLPAGSRHEWTFDLDDGGWQASAPFDQLLAAKAELAALYEVPPTVEAARHGVWVGCLRSRHCLL